MPQPTEETFDAVIVGSGFGGSLVAHALVRAGQRVLLLERGDWVERGPHNWESEGAFILTPHYTRETPYRVRQGRGWEEMGSCTCVGGASVFYGGASYRFREQDFAAAPEVAGGSGAEWPLGYADLEPYYTRAEQLLGIAGEAGRDPTEPSRSGPYPRPPAPLARASRRIGEAAESLGLHPFPIPMAIHTEPGGTGGCVSCTTCDAFACAVGAKNDLATRVLPELLTRGLQLRTGVVATRLVERGGRIEAVEGFDRHAGKAVRFRGRTVVVACGALASPHLLLASGLERLNPGGAVVGRYLMRHCNAMVYGVFPRRPDPEGEHHKQISIHDFYFGDDARGAPPGKLGNLQQVMTPPVGLVREMLPRPVGALAAHVIPHLTGLLAIAEDQPRLENRVEVDPARRDRFGLPQLRVHHRYTRRDLQARGALVRRARQILRRAGAPFTVTWNVTTFSHAVGTVRMGEDPRNSVLDRDCRFRGVENLRVVDGSFMPRSAGVNPSLTIAANALRVGDRLLEAS